MPLTIVISSVLLICLWGLYKRWKRFGKEEKIMIIISYDAIASFIVLMLLILAIFFKNQIP